jgi:hypothetical protein
MPVQNHDRDQQIQSHALTEPGRSIRVIPREQREKDVARVSAAVLQGENDPRQIEAGLHRTFGRYNKAAFAEREVITQLLQANLGLARAVRKLSDELAELRSSMAGRS